MPLLFKNRRQFVQKKQSGGNIPYYYEQKVRMADTPLFNPGDLLKAYAQKLPDISTGPKEIPDDVRKGLEITSKGKNNERHIVADKLAGIRNEVEAYYRAGVDPPYNLINELKDQQLNLNGDLLNNKDRLVESEKEAKNNAAGENLVYRNGDMLVKEFTVDKDGNKKFKYNWMDAAKVKHFQTDSDNLKQIMDFNPKSVYKGPGFTQVEPVNHAEAFKAAENDNDDLFLFANGANTANSLSTGMSSSKAIEKLESAYYKDLGSFYKETGTSKNDGTVLNAAGHYEGNNADALNNAKALVVSTIDPSIKNALMPKAWSEDHISVNKNGEVVREKTTTHKQAVENLERMLTFLTQQKLNIKGKDTEKEAIDLTKEGSSGGGSEGPYTVIPSNITDLAADFTPRGIESDGRVSSKFMDDNKNVWLDIPSLKAVTASKTLASMAVDQGKTTTDGENKNLELVKLPGYKHKDNPFTPTSIAEAKFVDGTKIPEDIKSKIIVRPEEPVKVDYMPVTKEGKFLTDASIIKNIKPFINEYSLEINDLNKRVAASNSMSKANYYRSMKAIDEKFHSKLPNLTLKPFYVLQGAAIMKSSEVDPNMKDKDGNRKPGNYSDVVSKPAVLSDAAYSLIEEGLGMVGKKSSEYLSFNDTQTRTMDIYLPLESTAEMWELQQDLLIDKNKATFDYVKGVEQDKDFNVKK